MNTMLNGLKAATNYTETTNGAVAHKSTGSKVYDMYANGGAMRVRCEEDIITMFKNAYEEDAEYALKCLFYLRDIRGIGAGERRFFRVVLHWLASYDKDAVIRNMQWIPYMGRWDDLYALVDTKCEAEMFAFIKHQLAIDVQSETPSLMAKWLKSENATSKETIRLGGKTRRSLNMTHKQYRKVLAALRTKINIVEKLMSENRWDEIQFDKIPGKAGLIYRNAFAKHDVERAKANQQTYAEFINDENTEVKTGGLTFPYEMVREVTKNLVYDQWDYNMRTDLYKVNMTELQRKAVEKYWNQQKDFLEGKDCKMLVCADTSGSMTCGDGKLKPIDAAISLAMYCAERVGGPFKNHYISFSSRPQLIEIEGVDFADKVRRIYQTNLCENTDLVATFELLRKVSKDAAPEDRLDTIVVISDMQIDSSGHWFSQNRVITDMEAERIRWEADGLKMPRLVYWDVNSVKDTILDLGPDVSCVSGASAALFMQVLSSKSGMELCMETLNNERYAPIH